MVQWPALIQVFTTFLISLWLLHRYANFKRLPIVLTLAVFIAWFFALLSIAILPVDIANTAYRQCKKDAKFDCNLPSTFVSSDLLKKLWRLIYWNAFFLNWFILPVVQSYAEAGDFTTVARLKSALKYRFTYYRNLFIVSLIAFIYYAIKFPVDAHNLVSLCISISNTFSLAIMLPLLGYGLVDLPRKFYFKSLCKRRLDFLYFKVAKVNEERILAEHNMDEAMEKVEKAYISIGKNHHLTPFIQKICDKCPTEFRERVFKSPTRSNSGRVFNTESELANVHQELKKCLFDYNRTLRQWDSYINKAMAWEDIRLNKENEDHVFVTSFLNSYSSERYSSVLFKKYIYTPRVQWWWKCVISLQMYKYLSFIFTGFSTIIIWSEFTFVIRKEPLNLFELVYKFASNYQQYFLIELFTLITLIYLFSCTFLALFKIRLYDYFYLAPNQQTSGNSLAMSGINFCRMTIPICLNFLGIIHLDSHVLNEQVTEETVFTTVMGHMDLFSSTFFMLMPILLLFVCFLAYFNLISKLLDIFGIEQFLVDNSMTNLLITDGEAFVNREKNKRIRQLESQNKQQRWNRQRPNTTSNSQLITNDPNGILNNDSAQNAELPCTQATDNSKWDFLDFASHPERPSENNV